MGKKIAAGLGILVVVLAIGVGYLWSNLGSVIKSTVDKYGSAATQATVHLGGVDLSLTSGEGSLSDLSVGSPKGFSADQALYLGKISVRLDPKSVTGNGPIVIKQVVIDKPQVMYEVTATGDSNLKTIARNAENYANSFGGGKKKAAAKPAAEEKAPARKIIIEDLSITNGQVAITQPMLQGKQLSAPLPTIHVRNIG
ncbi:MAG: AsmA family protein, partial [Alphaproteobacteria bacterium]|nr:AsmA family protein [Alphaproteobacteria bacterium]